MAPSVPNQRAELRNNPRGRMGRQMDQSRLNSGEQLIAVSAIVLFLASFLQWLGGSNGRITLGGRKVLALPDTNFAISAWGSTLTLIAELIGIAMLLYVVLKLVGLQVPTHVGRLSSSQVLLALGIAAFALVLIKFVTGTSADLNSFGLPNLPASGTSGFRLAFQRTREPGIFVGLIATAGLSIGSFLSLRAERADPGT
jgi:hypothetical protein